MEVSERALRVALVTNIPAPYRVPVFRSLAATPGWTFRLFVSADSEFDRSWRVGTEGLDVEVVRGISHRSRSRTRGRVALDQRGTRHWPLGLPAALRRFAPDVVVSAELGPRTALAALFCRLRGIPLVVWSYHSRVSASAAGRLRRLVWRWLLRRADAVVGMGSQAREVLTGPLGVPAERVFDAPNAHDHEAVSKALASLNVSAARTELIARLGLRERIALVVGRLVPAKGVRPLLAAWRRLPDPLRREWSLLFVGSGPLAETVQAEAADGRPGEIVQLPAVQPAEVVRFYASADLLVFPTLSEPWGLVVNEAFACGLPVLCSRLAGCADDLIEPGENGWLCDPDDPDALATALEAALRSEDHARLGEAARARSAAFGPETLAAGLRRAVLAATAATVGPCRSGLPSALP